MERIITEMNDNDWLNSEMDWINSEMERIITEMNKKDWLNSDVMILCNLINRHMAFTIYSISGSLTIMKYGVNETLGTYW